MLCDLLIRPPLVQMQCVNIFFPCGELFFYSFPKPSFHLPSSGSSVTLVLDRKSESLTIRNIACRGAVLFPDGQRCSVPYGQLALGLEPFRLCMIVALQIVRKSAPDIGLGILDSLSTAPCLEERILQNIFNISRIISTQEFLPWSMGVDHILI